MSEKKIFLFLPDGGGLRNFAYSSFKKIGDELGYQTVYWNASGFPIQDQLGYEELKMKQGRVQSVTPLFLRARKHIELNIWKRKFKDTIYDKYKFPFSFKGFRNVIKSSYVLSLIQFYATEKGLQRLKNKIETVQRKNPRYDYAKQQLQEYQPALVFCSNQRNSQGISALLAARDLGITTVCFIQSWDNVPKAMLVYETDYYLVWSDLMKKELLQYYPFISEEQVFVTGTPQFEMHFDTRLRLPKEVFFKQQGLDVDKRYICFSGDDLTTSPLDHFYLEDVAVAVRSLNTAGENLGIIYRKCPFDISDRYDAILKTYADVIDVIDPKWSQINGIGDMMPMAEDAQLLYNICEHSELVTNVCSTTVFDFAVHDKPCIYFNYEQPQLKKGIRDIGQNYEYVHFRSMPSIETVVFCTAKEQLKAQVKQLINEEVSNVAEGKKWFAIVAGEKTTESTKRMWDVFSAILSQEVDD